MSPRETNQELVPSYVEEDATDLKRRFEEFGYLYLKQAVPAQLCQSLLDRILRHRAPDV